MAAKTQVSLALVDPVSELQEVVCEPIACTICTRGLHGETKFSAACTSQESGPGGPFYRVDEWLGRVVGA